MLKKILSSLVIIGTLQSNSFAGDKVIYKVDNDMHVSNKVTFTSDAKLVSFSGSTNKILGTATVDFKDISNSSGEIKIDLSTLETGISKRDDHMKSVLNVNSHPFATFKLNELKSSIKEIPKGKSIFVNAIGNLTINGITKELKTLLEITNLPESDKWFRGGNWIMLKTDFEIKLSDFSIEPPGIVPLKVNNSVKINLTVMGKEK